MDKKNQRFLFYLINGCECLLFAYMLGFNPKGIRMLIGALSFLIFAGILLILKVLKIERTIKLTAFFTLALIYWLSLIDQSGASGAIPLIFMGAVILNLKAPFCHLLSGFAILSGVYAQFVAGNYRSVSQFLPEHIGMIFLYGVFWVILSLLRQSFDQRLKISKANDEISLKSQALEKTTTKLRETMESLEDMAAEKERNKIAREIHDTVGHTLTTVLVEIEAGKRLMEKDQNLAKEKLDLAQGQVRKGLNDIRRSVRLLKEDDVDFMPSIQLLIEETQKHTGVVIQQEIEGITSLPGQRGKVIYHCLQEGLTNGIRHGNATFFKMKLKRGRGLSFSLEDNGGGLKKDAVMGFGLSAMKDRVEQIGGNVTFKNTPGGFWIGAEIPEEEEEYGSHSCADCR